MFARIAAAAAMIALAGCAGLEPAGRNAQRAPTASAPAPAPRTAPPAQTTAPAPAQTSTPEAAPEQQPAATTPAPAPQRTAPPAAAPEVSAPTPAPESQQAASRGSSDGDVIVPGQVETQLPPPQGDPRSNEERRADVRAWDRCVIQVQNAFDADPMRPQLTTPEEYCRQSLGMADRTAVPISRQRR